MSDTRAAALAQHPFLAELGEEALARFAQATEEREYPAGSFIFREGEEADRLYLIQKGRVALELNVPGRGATQLESLRPGDILGLSWLFPPYRWHLDARAVEAVTILAVDAEELRTCLVEEPALCSELAMRLLHQLYQRLERVRMQRLDLYKAGA
ncbi:MAG TPA: cyclic nucleotide-binding domain-containing protein [Polyangia bacterium]|nr:cyclic nucleotide-binding domain-containing protein [Polyangia bacterium]